MSKLNSKYLSTLALGCIVAFVAGFSLSYLVTPRYGAYGFVQGSSILLKQGSGLSEISLIKPGNMTSFINTKYNNARFEARNGFSASATIAKGTRDLVRIKTSATTANLAIEANQRIMKDLKETFKSTNKKLAEFVEYQRQSLESEIRDLKKDYSKNGLTTTKAEIQSRAELMISLGDPEELNSQAFRLIYNEAIADTPLSPRRLLFGMIAAILFGLVYSLFADLFFDSKDNA